VKGSKVQRREREERDARPFRGGRCRSPRPPCAPPCPCSSSRRRCCVGRWRWRSSLARPPSAPAQSRRSPSPSPSRSSSAASASTFALPLCIWEGGGATKPINDTGKQRLGQGCDDGEVVVEGEASYHRCLFVFAAAILFFGTSSARLRRQSFESQNCCTHPPTHPPTPLGEYRYHPQHPR